MFIRKNKLIIVLVLIAVSSSVSTAFAVGGNNIIFRTFDGITSHEVMRITSDQRVGIGTATPGRTLDLVSSNQEISRFQSTGDTAWNVINAQTVDGISRAETLYDIAGNVNWATGAINNGSSFDIYNGKTGTSALTIDGATNKIVCTGCVTQTDVAPGIQVIDCTNLVPDANLVGCNLQLMDLHGKDLTGANLSGANLASANLDGATLINTNLGVADLTGAILSGANLNGANLSGATLINANLSSANLSNANLSGANLDIANLNSPTLAFANLNGANLSGATNQPIGVVGCLGTPINADFTCG